MTTPETPVKANWLSAHPLSAIAILLVLCLAPFLDKAVHIDDPLFVWTGEQIQRHPGDFYGFDVNWFGSPMPMYLANVNPPLTSYCLAVAGSLLGWDEMGLHAAFMLAALAAAWGVYHLARAWCERPLLAAIIAIFTPVFLISSTTLMCDVLMLALLVWAVVLWESGLRNNRLTELLAAGGLAGLAVLTKYNAVLFLPLLPVLGFLRKRTFGGWLLTLAVPLVMIGAFEGITAKMYGRGLLSTAAAYASANRFVFPGGWMSKWIISLAFIGGCILPATFFAPLLWPRRHVLVGGLLLFGTSLGALALLKELGPMDLRTGPGATAGFRLQAAFLIAAGLHVLLLAASACWRRRDPVSVILALWIIVGFLFAAVLNWTANGRSLLPIVPPVAILIVRRLGTAPLAAARLGWSLVPSAAIALYLVLVDYQLANTGRTAAQLIAAKFPPTADRLWFEGHWGFQYYMQKLGARPVNFKQSTLEAGDLLFVPSNNTNVKMLPADTFEALGRLELNPSPWLSTMQASVGAGFYAADWGPLPFAFGRVRPEVYSVFRITSRLQLRAKPKTSEAAASPGPSE
jgi:4-amino-4-deoxy-L-arabinose transferase-like glycosyltransferase